MANYDGLFSVALTRPLQPREIGRASIQQTPNFCKYFFSGNELRRTSVDIGDSDSNLLVPSRLDFVVWFVHRCKKFLGQSNPIRRRQCSSLCAEFFDEVCHGDLLVEPQVYCSRGRPAVGARIEG